MEHYQNMIAAIKSSTRHKGQISRPFLTFSSVTKKLAVVERLFW